ncbi:MAG: hypothetical protein K8R74_13695 [Bacteroidales bacterium]|nr:hypothetical protein [Bacteroidales bacterium]
MKTKLLLLLFISSYTLSFGQWNISTVDNTGDAGKYSDIAYDSQGNPHITYYNVDNFHNVRYIFWNGLGWESFNIKSIQLYGSWNLIHNVTISIDHFDTIYIAYSYQTYSGSPPFDLYLSICKIKSGEMLQNYTIEHSNSYIYHNPAITTYYQSGISVTIPSISYSYNNDICLYYFSHLSNSWDKIIVDQNCGTHNDITSDLDGNLHISYYDNYGKDLKYAFYDWSDLFTTIVDGLNDDVGEYNSIGIDDNGHVHISYYDATNDQLKHAEVSPQ